MRVKTGYTRRHHHQKVLHLAKGYWMTRSKRYKVAHEAVMHAGQYAYNGRRIKKRDLRRLWIIRLNAALRSLGVTYSKFIPALKKANIGLDRKILADLAIRQPETLKEIVKKAGFTLPK